MCNFQSSIWHLLLLFIRYVAPPFWDRFSWWVTSFDLMCGASFWFCISHFLYFAIRVFSVCVLLRISRSLSRFLFTFVVAYVFFSAATSSSIRKFSSLFLCLFVNVEVKTLVLSSLFPRALLFSRLLFSWHFKAKLVSSFHCQYAGHVLLSSIFQVQI